MCDGKPESGSAVWVVERDERGDLCQVSRYMFLAEVRNFVIAAEYMNGREDIESILDYHAKETIVSRDTDLAVFPVEDCYATQTAAYTVLDRQKDSRDGFYDDAGGYHEGGTGYSPNGKFCGECSCEDCSQCPIWRRDATLESEGGDKDV